MGKKVLCYGNCQLYAQAAFFRKCNVGFDVTYEACQNTELEKWQFLDLIRESDIIVTQPIKDEYRKKNYLGTSFVLENAKPDCKIVIFPSLYFNFYNFDVTHYYGESQLDIPSSYQYQKLISAYNSGQTVDEFLEQVVKNKNLLSADELESIATEGVDRLRTSEMDLHKYKAKRETIKLISVSNYVNDNYKERLLWWTPNHPTRHIQQELASKIFSQLNIPNVPDVNLDPLESMNKCMIYACVKNVVNFDLSTYQPYIRNPDNDSGEMTNRGLCKLYYKTYDSLKK